MKDYFILWAGAVFQEDMFSSGQMQLPAATLASLQKFCHLDKLALMTQHGSGCSIFKSGIPLVRIYRVRYWNNVQVADFHWRCWKCICLHLFPILFQRHSNYNFNSSVKKIFWQRRLTLMMLETCFSTLFPLVLLFFKPLCLIVFPPIFVEKSLSQRSDEQNKAIDRQTVQPPPRWE